MEYYDLKEENGDNFSEIYCQSDQIDNFTVLQHVNCSLPCVKVP